MKVPNEDEDTVHSIQIRELFDINRIQMIQDEYAKVASLCVACLDSEGKQITGISGPEELKARAVAMLGEQQVRDLLDRVMDGGLEDQAVESMEDGSGYVATVAARTEGSTLLYWVVFCFNESEDGLFFDACIDLLRDGTAATLTSRIVAFNSEAASRRDQDEKREMMYDLRSAEAMTEIVQLLDSEGSIDEIMLGWLKVLGRQLSVDSAQIFRLNDEDKTMDVLCEYLKEGQISTFDRTNRVAADSFLSTDKVLVYSADTNSDLQYVMQSKGLKAVMVYPLAVPGNDLNMVLSLNHRDKRHRWEMSEIKFASDAVKIIQSIIAKRIQKNSLASSYVALESILDNVGCAIYVSSMDAQRCVFANKRLQNLFSKELHDGSMQKLLDSKQRIFSQDDSGYEVYHKDKNRWYDLYIKEITWVDNTQVVLYSMFDITEKKKYQTKIEQQANTDFLTGLYNRMCCEKDLAIRIDEAKSKKLVGTLLYLDLDDFKHINDGLGHQYGDVLLKSISNSFRRISGIENACYRVGGDEFIIIVSPVEQENCSRIMHEIKNIFEKPWFLKDADYYCTMSMGIVSYPTDSDNVQELIKKADLAMYEAKKGGKNQTSRYNDTINSASGRRLDMEKNMRDAIADEFKEFEVYYQPITDVTGGRTSCAGAEALIRWNSEKFGFIRPDEFISLAEYLGLITPIGGHVLKEACKACKKWNDNGYPDYKINVNLSVVQLLQLNIVETIRRTLEETKLRPENLTLEVTESLAINDMSRMKEILNRIKALGVKIALDDFGTGYSSLNHIREIPFDLIKVDQSFVKELAEDAYSQAFVKMVAELAGTLGVPICVEGIETEDQVKVLRDMKIKYIQGYYFDRPMQLYAFENKYVSGTPEREVLALMEEPEEAQEDKTANGSEDRSGDKPEDKPAGKPKRASRGGASAKNTDTGGEM